MTLFKRIFSAVWRKKFKYEALLLDDQHRLLARFLPWLYLLIITLLAISWLSVHKGESHFMWIIAFAGFTIFTVLRSLYWWGGERRFGGYTPDQKRKDLNSIAFVSPALCLFFSCFSSYLVYIDGSLDHIIISMSIVTLSIAAAFTLTVIPAAAMTTLLAALGPLAATFVFFNDQRFVMLGAMLFAILFFCQFLIAQSFLSFADLVTSRARLENEKNTSQRRAKSVERLAFYDALTDLPNRRKFVLHLANSQKKTKDDKDGFAVGILQIGGFKAIEEVYGRDACNGLLRQVVERLTGLSEKFYQNEGLLARLGSNKFVFLAPKITDDEQAHFLGDEIHKSLSAAFEIPRGQLNVAFSCGVVLYPRCDSNPDQLIARADIARRETAASDTATIGVFNSSMELANLRRTRVEHALRKAVQEDEIVPWYQPIVQIDEGRIIGFEALARWHDKTLGHVGPDEFIEIAEQTQLIERFTLNVFSQALVVAQTWSDETKLFFNLSPNVLTRQGSVEKLLAILKDSKVRASRVEIELTETAVMQDVELAKQKIQLLKTAGVGIALGDFGSGYSSLSQIRDLPLDKIKIDKSFTDQICNDDKIRKIVQGVIQLCNDLDITCVAEGIEDLEQLGVLSDMKCELGQGYLFSRPIQASTTSRRVVLINAA